MIELTPHEKAVLAAFDPSRHLDPYGRVRSVDLARDAGLAFDWHTNTIALRLRSMGLLRWEATGPTRRSYI